MLVLGIETSCDETSVAVVKDGRRVLANEISSSLEFHKKYGGVIPEIASRMQLETIAGVADCAIKKSGATLSDIDLIAFTDKPGLMGSLLVGVSFAKALSLARDLPLLGINHIYSHIYASFLSHKDIKLPFVSLVVSGGHTSLFFVKDFKKIETLGQTQDDACGEAFDKVAKILGLTYPGGPLLEKLAKNGDPDKFKFRCSGTNNPLDFSFSGIKTAVLYLVKEKKLKEQDKKDISASFQETVIETLIQKSLLACSKKNCKRLILGGGVVANTRLRQKFQDAAARSGIKIYFPAQALCMDNAAMVAGLGFQLFKKKAR